MKLLHALLLCAAALFGAAAQAQGFPTKPIRLVVPFPAGGATDIFARAVSQRLGEKLGTTIVVDNKPGAGGAIGSDIAAKAQPDGYTLLLATSSTHSIGPSFGEAALRRRWPTSRRSPTWATRPTSWSCPTARPRRR